MSRQPSPHGMSNDLLKKILLTSVHRPVSVTGDGTNFSAVSETVFGVPNTSDAVNSVRMMKSAVCEDTLLATVAYNQRHYHETPLSTSSVGAFEQDSNLEDYSLDDLSPQGLNGSGDDPMLTIGMDHDSSGTNDHSNSDPIPGSESCFLISQISQDKIIKKKGRPAKSCIASSSVHGRFGVRCPVCSKAFNNSSALAKHKLTHSDERKYVCQICSKTFKRQDHLNGHMLTHSSKKPFECRYKDCGKSYCDARSLKRHLEHHHADDSFPTSTQAALISFETSTCNQQTNNLTSTSAGNYMEQFSPVESLVGSSNGVSDKHHHLSSWTANSSIVDEPLPHKCDLCNRNFKNLPALNGHMRLHGGYLKKDGVDDLGPLPLEVSKRKSLNVSLTSVPSAVQGSEKTITKFSDVSVGLLAPEADHLYLPHIAQTQSACSVYHPNSTTLDVESVEDAIDAMTAQQNAVAISQVAKTGQMQDRTPKIQVLSLPPSIAINLNPVEFHKVHDCRMTYLSSESVSSVVSDPEGITLPNDAVANMGQQFYHITSFPALSLVPDLSLKSEMTAFGSFRGAASTSSKTPLHSWCNNIEVNNRYKYRLEPMKYKAAWMPRKALDNDVLLLSNELEKHLSDPDEMSTDSAKDTDEEDTTVAIKETKSHRERRRWASADADHFTSRKIKASHQSPSILELAALKNANWKAGAINRLARKFYRNEEDQDSPPAIDDIRALRETAIADQIEEEFRSPNVTSALLLKFRRKNRPEPLIIPPQSCGFAFHSRLRSPRIGGGTVDSKLSFTPYTPPPMLSPIRNGSGLFCQLSSLSPVSAPVGLRTGFTPQRSSRGSVLAPFPVSEVIAEEEELGLAEQEVIAMESDPPMLEPPPETDISPHVNIGPDYQAEIPSMEINRQELSLSEPNKEVLVWNPAVLQNTKECEVRAFMDFACCAAVPFNGSNREYAHHVLSICDGNVKKAAIKLMQRNPSLASGHSLHSYMYQEADIWSTKEIEAFQNALTKFDKDFFRISEHVRTKSTQKCIQFYYMWKKVACDEHKRLRIIRRKREQENLYNLRSSKADYSKEQAVNDDIKSFSSEVLRLPFSAYVASDNSVGGEPEDIIAESDLPFSSFHDVTCDLPYEETVETEEYPCRICGKVFSKVKSRSAHMKTHRPMGNSSQQVDRHRQTYNSHDSWQFSLS